MERTTPLIITGPTARDREDQLIEAVMNHLTVREDDVLVSLTNWSHVSAFQALFDEVYHRRFVFSCNEQPDVIDAHLDPGCRQVLFVYPWCPYTNAFMQEVMVGQLSDHGNIVIDTNMTRGRLMNEMDMDNRLRKKSIARRHPGQYQLFDDDRMTND